MGGLESNNFARGMIPRALEPEISPSLNGGGASFSRQAVWRMPMAPGRFRLMKTPSTRDSDTVTGVGLKEHLMADFTGRDKAGKRFFLTAGS